MPGGLSEAEGAGKARLSGMRRFCYPMSSFTQGLDMTLQTHETRAASASSGPSEIRCIDPATGEPIGTIEVTRPEPCASGRARPSAQNGWRKTASPSGARCSGGCSIACSTTTRLVEW